MLADNFACRSGRRCHTGGYQQEQIESREDAMNVFRQSSSRAILILALLLAPGLSRPGFAQSPVPPALPALPAQLISVAEAHAIIEGANAYAREKNLRLGVVILDASGEMVAGEHMDGAPGRNIQFAEGKAFAAV